MSLLRRQVPNDEYHGAQTEGGFILQSAATLQLRNVRRRRGKKLQYVLMLYFVYYPPLYCNVASYAPCSFERGMESTSFNCMRGGSAPWITPVKFCARIVADLHVFSRSLRLQFRSRGRVARPKRCYSGSLCCGWCTGQFTPKSSVHFELFNGHFTAN